MYKHARSVSLRTRLRVVKLFLGVVGQTVKGQGRPGDKANVPLDAHGCPACPHPAIGTSIQGSPDVNVNGRPALRVDDPGIHRACCGTNTWAAAQGSLTVFINGKGAHRMGDQTRHCGGIGQLVEGSPNVIIGESGGRSEVGAMVDARAAKPESTDASTVRAESGLSIAPGADPNIMLGADPDNEPWLSLAFFGVPSVASLRLVDGDGADLARLDLEPSVLKAHDHTSDRAVFLSDGNCAVKLVDTFRVEELQ